jgi:hypothetical protein
MYGRTRFMPVRQTLLAAAPNKTPQTKPAYNSNRVIKAEPQKTRHSQWLFGAVCVAGDL